MPPDSVPVLLVSELRDSRKIDAELARLLDAGHSVVRLAEVAGQRLLLARLRGSWHARVEIDGFAGPELAAEMDAPLNVICRGAAGPAAGRGLLRGNLTILGAAGELLGTLARGGRIDAYGPCGARAGLLLSGAATLVVGGPWGPLLGERLQGGRIVICHPPAEEGAARKHAGFGLRTGDLYVQGEPSPAWLDRHLEWLPAGEIPAPDLDRGSREWPDPIPPLDRSGPWYRAVARKRGA